MENNTSKKIGTAKKIFKIIVDVVITVYIIAALLFSVCVFTSMRTGHPSVFGYTFLYVRTDSMESDASDAIFEGDLVICRDDVDFHFLDNGEIIAYKSTVYQQDPEGNEQVRYGRTDHL